MRNALGIKSPFAAGSGELQVAQVPERHIGCVLRGENLAGEENFAVGYRSAFALFPQLDDRVQMARIALYTVSDQ